MTSLEISRAFQTAEDRAKEALEQVRRICNDEARAMVGGLTHELECAYREIELLKAQRGE